MTALIVLLNSELTTYSYDSEGNMTSMTIKDSNNNIMTSETYTYDIYNRLIRTTHLDDTYTEQSYDALGNVATKRDENGNVTTFSYDVLNRLISVTDPNTGITSYTYDKRNNLLSVTDANSNVTSYNYDSVNRLSSTISPDTGTTTYSYDPNGNLATKTDANSVTTTYVYDVLNRQTAIQFPDSTQNITYSYDNPQYQNSKGRLTSMTDPSGTTWYDYDKMGRVTMETKQVNNLYYRTQYAYDLNGNLTSITYPGGRKIAYTYNQLNRATSVAETLNGVTRTLASNIGYLPFGNTNSVTYGNGLQRNTGYDNRYRINSITTGGVQNLSYNYFDNSNISGITDNLTPSKNKSYTYDPLNRLTIANGQWGAITYAYDSVGNRTYETTDTGNTTYSYNTNTNKLASTSGEKVFSFNFDNNGNTAGENTRQYIYNQNQRMIKAMEGTTVLGEYIYNGKGQRSEKWIPSQNKCTIFHYNQNGLLISESTSAGNIKAEYVYLNGQPLAKIENNNIYYYHDDHLGTPMMMTNESGQTVWTGEYLPFGEQLSITGTITNNLRFPGQYFDSETGLHQNWNRDYRPPTGSYAQADPILQPMVNSTSELKLKPTYSSCSKSNLSWQVPNLLSNPQDLHPYFYVGNNPVNFVDPLGLKGCGPYGMSISDSYGFGSCCDEHDDCYNKCKPKKDCDKAFSKCMNDKCKGIKDTNAQKNCYCRASRYYNAVKYGGFISYTPSCGF